MARLPLGGRPTLRRGRLDHAGVSEVLGTILVLLITVIIFSSIVLWVFTLPTPRAGVSVAFNGFLSGNYVGGEWNGADVKLDHLGGQDLHEGSTRIYLTIDNATEVLKTRGTAFIGKRVKDYGVDGPDATWNVGETWGYQNESISQDANVSVMVVDLERGLLLWRKPLLGTAGAQAPIFLDKWVDPAPATATRDPVKPGDKFAILAKVTDPDSDLNPESVSAYLTFGIGVSPIGRVPLRDDGPLLGSGDLVAGDGVYTHTLSYQAQKKWDGGIIILNATDNGGRGTQTRLILKVLDTGASTQVGGPGSLGFGSATQRYEIFEVSDWDSLRWEATGTRSFTKGQGVVVAVATKKIITPDLRNTFLLWDPYDNREVVYSDPPYTNPVTASSVPSTTDAFVLTEFVSGFYVYEYRFNTTSGFDGFQLQLGYYPLEFELITSQTPAPENRLYVTDAIRVTDAAGGSPNYPRVETYKDAAHTMPTTAFNFTETMYVKVFVESTDGDFDIGNVVISDFFGNLPIWASPGTTPVSVALQDDAVSYAFSVDLSRPNLDPWNFGTVSYNLAIMNVQDKDESYGRVWGQIQVTGPRWKLDIAMGLFSTSQKNFDLAVYGDFFDNIEGWTEHPYETFLASPGNKAPVNPIKAQVFGDLDGDGDLDILAGTEMGEVWWYRNRDGKAHSMSRTVIDTLVSSVSGVAVGHIDEDPDLDAAVGTTTGDVWWYRNDGAWSANFVDNTGASVSALQLSDVNGDGAADLIVGLDAGPNSVRAYLNNGQGVFGKVTFEDTLMASDVPSPGHGTLFLGESFLDTRDSDNQYQQVKEVGSDGFVAAWEAAGLVETVQGTFLDTYGADGVVEILTEGESGPRYTLGFPGHRYLFPNMTALASDTFEIHLVGHISSGDEDFAVGWSKDGLTVTWMPGLITGLTPGEYIWSLSGVDWSDETLFLHIMDVDDSTKDRDTDAQLTSLSVDLLYILQPESGSISSFAKVWRSASIPGGKDAYKFFVEAHHTFNAENDDLLMQVAAAPHGPYYGLLVVSKTTDDDGTQSVSLPTDIGGLSLYILAQDTDRRFGATVNDTFSFDHLYFRSYEATPVYSHIAVGAPTQGLTVADIDGDGHQDIVVATTGNALHVYYGDGTGTAWPARDTLFATGALLTVDVGFVSADSAFDIVVGTEDTKILLFTNGGSRGSWFRTTIASLSTTTTSTLRVGDVDGDNWDDVVFGTENGFLVYLRNDQGSGWRTTIVIQMKDRIDVVDIGDADRGVLIRPHPY